MNREVLIAVEWSAVCGIGLSSFQGIVAWEMLRRCALLPHVKFSEGSQGICKKKTLYFFFCFYLYVATFFFPLFQAPLWWACRCSMNFTLWVHNLNLYYVYLTEVSLTSRIDN